MIVERKSMAVSSSCAIPKEMGVPVPFQSIPSSSIPVKKPSSRKWFKQWVPNDTVLNPGKCFLMKWVHEDMLKALESKFPKAEPEPEPEPEPEYEVIYLCNYEGCGKVFADQGAIRKHAQVHGEKQHVCHYEGCGKRFAESSKLKRHFLTHTGEKRFICPYDGCGKAFSLDFNLRSHMRIHTQENYHVCPFEDCGKRYAHEYKLRTHLRSHHYMNVPADVKLTPPQSIEKEIVVPKPTPAVRSSLTNPDRPFVCPHKGCDKRYIHEYKLNLHLRREHVQGEPLDETVQPGRLGEGDGNFDEGSKGGNNGKRDSPKPKIRIVTNNTAPIQSNKRKWTSAPPIDLNANTNMVGRHEKMKEAAGRDTCTDSEETEEEDQDESEEEHSGGFVQRQLVEDDYEESDDDMD